MKIITTNRKISRSEKCYIIAEVGINHNGNLELAKKIIKAAHEAGADAVKFQKRDIELVYGKEYLQEYRESPFGNTQRDLKENLEFNKNQYIELRDFSHKLNLDFIVSPWDEKSVDFVCEIGVDCLKIASPCLHDIKLLKYIRTKQVPLIVSTGMSDKEQVERALEILKGAPIVLLHCVSTYPTREEDINMNRLNTLKQDFDFIDLIGYSGHEMDKLPALVAVSMGAKVIEKHVTMSRELWGSDHKVSLQPLELKELVSGIREVEKILGNNQIKVLPNEVAAMRKLQRKRKIDSIVLDIDGVLTDGKIYSNDMENNNEMKILNYKDLDAITAFTRKGYSVYIITKENTDINKSIIKRINPTEYAVGVENKYDAIKDLAKTNKENLSRMSYIGDSYSDKGVFNNIKYTFAPSDAIKVVKDNAYSILNTKAGEGCIAEMIEKIESINSGIA